MDWLFTTQIYHLTVGVVASAGILWNPLNLSPWMWQKYICVGQQAKERISLHLLPVRPDISHIYIYKCIPDTCICFLLPITNIWNGYPTSTKAVVFKTIWNFDFIRKLMPESTVYLSSRPKFCYFLIWRCNMEKERQKYAPPWFHRWC